MDHDKALSKSYVTLRLFERQIIDKTWVVYTANKKFMSNFGCRGYDPYSAIVSTLYCQNALAYESAK